jgi:hypothetical protein
MHRRRDSDMCSGAEYDAWRWRDFIMKPLKKGKSDADITFDDATVLVSCLAMTLNDIMKHPRPPVIYTTAELNKEDRCSLKLDGMLWTSRCGINTL